MKNKVDDFYGYNDTISGMIAKMCNEAFVEYRIQNRRVDELTAMSRAIGGTFKKNIEILTQQYSMNYALIEQGLNKEIDFCKHSEKATFMKFAETLYDSGNYRIEKFNNQYEYVFRYQLAVFKIGELK